MSTIPLNGKPPLGYRIGTSDRTLGEATDTPEDFIVLNTTNNAVFQVTGGVWVDATGTFPADLYAAWLATTTVFDPNSYRVGTSDRTVGDATTAPEDFLVINSTNNNVFQVQSGLWADVTGSIDPGDLSDLLAAWQAA